MSIQSDAKDNVGKMKINNQITCGVTLTLTQAHWDEAKENTSDQKEAQITYIKGEVAAGCHDGCKCTHTVSSEYTEPDTVLAYCKADPTSKLP